MSFSLIRSPSAKFDLKDTAAFIAEDREAVAERFVRSIFQTVERLADFPESVRIVPEFGNPSIREIILKPLRMFNNPYTFICQKKKARHFYFFPQ
jgi:plasmid stabilization system protein ParE